MYTTLSEAPFEKPLKLVSVKNPNLSMRFQQMGFFEGSILTRHNETIQIQAIRIKGPEGERVLGGGMAAKVVVHLDDGRKFPLVEMKQGETGHIEGITGGTGLDSALATLGLHNDDCVTFIRKLPPMEHTIITENNTRIHLTESMAAKIWGKSGEILMQLVTAPRNVPFYVEKIIGGQEIISNLGSMQITAGTRLIPEGVRPAQILYMSRKNPLIVSSSDGLRLFLRQEDGHQIFVRDF